jgi:putative oxidoreductase
MGKLSAPGPTMLYIQSGGIPFPDLALFSAVAIEIAGGLALIVGFKTRWTAVLIATFTAATGCIFHSQLGDENQMIHFYKNVAIVGGLLQIAAFGSGRFGLDRVLRRR